MRVWDDGVGVGPEHDRLIKKTPLKAIQFCLLASESRDEFLRQTSWLVEACANSAVPQIKPPVRLPGQAALKRKADTDRKGLALDALRFSDLENLARRFALSLPARR